MREELKAYIKQLYLRNTIDADRFQQLNAAANDLLDAHDRQEAYQVLTELSTGAYPEFRRFITMNRLRAAEELETIFMEKVDQHLASQDLEKASLMLDLMQMMHTDPQ